MKLTIWKFVESNASFKMIFQLTILQSVELPQWRQDSQINIIWYLKSLKIWNQEYILEAIPITLEHLITSWELVQMTHLQIVMLEWDSNLDTLASYLK